MQTVSQEWIDNQKSAIRKPGFIVVDLPDVKFHYGSISYYIDKSTGVDRIYTDATGCNHINKCEYILKFDIEKMRDEGFYYLSFLSNGYEAEFVGLGKSELDTNGEFHYEGKGYECLCIYYTDKNSKLADVVGVVDISMEVYGIPRTDISSYAHSRSYDPVGFELPTNNISIDIYNYGDRYTDFYKTYANEQYKVNVKYGYILDSGEEIIQGGLFTMSDVQLADNTLTISGENLLEFVDDKLNIDLFALKANEEGYIYVHVTDVGTLGVKKIDLRDSDELSISVEDILAYLQNTANIPIQKTSVFSHKILETSINANCIEAIQSLITLLLVRCYVDRNDVLHYDECSSTLVNDGNHILLMNTLEKPSYTSTKKLKKFEVSKTTEGGASEVSDSTSVTGSYEIDYAIGSVDVDCVNNKLLSVDMSWYHAVSTLHYLMIYPDKVKMYYRHGTGEVGADVTYAPKLDIVEDIPVGNTGTICDIASPFGEPSDYDKIVNYFSNRDLYTFKVRGNPARDVGDYIDVSLTDDSDTSTYKKGLVLSSTLTYDGSFKEELEVRIIENEFEGETE